MFDVGDLLVLTFGDCVLKAEWLSGLYVFLRFFFKIQKNMTFYVFLSCCTRFLEHWPVPHHSDFTGQLPCHPTNSFKTLKANT